MTALVLASQSVARAAVLRQAGLAFTVRVAGVDEAGPKQAMRAEGAEAVAMHLAHAKAAAADQSDGALVIGADQVLVCEGISFDKPADMGEAASHLRRLRGQTHQLVTAVVLYHHGRPVWSHLACPSLTMWDFPDEVIAAYLEGDGAACLHTVGAYRVEGPGIQLFERIEGEWSAVLGLPMLALLAELRRRRAQPAGLLSAA